MEHIIDKIKSLAIENFEEIRECRRHLHRHPELSFEEFATSRYIQQQLTKFGVSFKADIATTGVVAIIEGNNPGKKNNCSSRRY